MKFNPLALLLDASLEGEFDLVQRIIYEVRRSVKIRLLFLIVVIILLLIILKSDNLKIIFVLLEFYFFMVVYFFRWRTPALQTMKASHRSTTPCVLVITTS